MVLLVGVAEICLEKAAVVVVADVVKAVVVVVADVLNSSVAQIAMHVRIAHDRSMVIGGGCIFS